MSIAISAALLVGAQSASLASEASRHDSIVMDEGYSPLARGGFSTPADLQPIIDALNNKRFDKVRTKATTLLERSAALFDSSKRERYLKASAYYLRALAAAKQGAYADAMDDFEQAAEMGHSQAPYQLASLLAIQASREPDPDARSRLNEKGRFFYEIGAELGDPVCMDFLQTIDRLEGRDVDVPYWFLLERMSESPEAMRRFAKSYREDINDSHRALFARVMQQRSLTGGEAVSTVSGVPGRSILTAAFVDLLMRRQLAFVWRAFYAEADPQEANKPLLEVYRTYRDAIPDNPFAEALLLGNATSGSEDKAIVALNHRDLAKSVLVGDGLIVRCGRLVHYATVWQINESEDRVLLLDPFYEFWQPTHNRCLTASSLEAYKYERQLVSVPWTEVQRMLVAVIAIRDRLVWA